MFKLWQVQNAVVNITVAFIMNLSDAG